MQRFDIDRAAVAELTEEEIAKLRAMVRASIERSEPEIFRADALKFYAEGSPEAVAYYATGLELTDREKIRALLAREDCPENSRVFTFEGAGYTGADGVNRAVRYLRSARARMSATDLTEALRGMTIGARLELDTWDDFTIEVARTK